MSIPPSALGARLFWVFVSLTAAICEETLWRGFAITELRAITGSTLLAVLISSLSFVFFHGGLQQGSAIFAYRFAISLILAAVYLRAGNLRWVMVIHFLMDASALMAIQID
jgi:membrane protease YdiL (CAAX protease family)